MNTFHNLLETFDLTCRSRGALNLEMMMDGG